VLCEMISMTCGLLRGARGAPPRPATPLMTLTTDLGLSICLSMFELRETGDWDIFLGPLERAKAETGGADQWVLKRRKFPGFAILNHARIPGIPTISFQ